MLWLLEALRYGDLIKVGYAIYSILSIVAALIVAVMYVVPRWRSKLFTTYWTFPLLILGAWGALKLVVFGVSDIYVWDSTVAFAIIAVIVAAIALAILVAIILWLRDCLRGPQPLRRIAKDASFWAAMLGGIFLLDFIEKRYQVPAFWIAMGVLLPGILVFAWWGDRRRAKEWAAGTEQRAAEQHRKVVEELPKDQADAGALAHYLRENGGRRAE